MAKRFWQPSKSTVERAPNTLVVTHEQPGVMPNPHWHAHVEVNFVLRGGMQYRMRDYAVRLERGSLALFWGGLPHQVVDTSDDPEFVAVHLPLVNFFRLRLPPSFQYRLIHGATLVTSEPDESDFFSFERWCGYMASSDQAKVDHAVDELLLRIERIPFEPFHLVDPAVEGAASASPADPQLLGKVRHICDFITDNFRHDIDSSDIATSADIHPKYAMSIFRKSTGMTLNEYVTLLRLSYAQAMLIKDDVNVLRVAMESGFGSLSAFNKSFRKICGKSPSDFRRDYGPRHDFRSPAGNPVAARLA